MINAVGKRIRSLMRGKDTLGRFSGNETRHRPQRLHAGRYGHRRRAFAGGGARRLGADRHRAGGGDHLDRRRGRAASRGTRPRNARPGPANARRAGSGKRRGSLEGYRPNIEREALRRENMRASDDISAPSTNAGSFPLSSRRGRPVSRRPAFHECLMRMRRSDGSLGRRQGCDADRRTPRSRTACSTIGCWSSSSPNDRHARCRRASTCRLIRRSIPIGGRLLGVRCWAAMPGAPSGSSSK